MKRVLIFILALLTWTVVRAQAPQSFNYQTVVRTVSGNVLANQTISLKISMLSGSATGAVVYSEVHSGKTTNDFGLVNLEIGKGTPVSGTFSTIGWAANSFYIKVEIDPAGGTAYQSMGTSQLVSVPYALHTKSVEVETDGDITNEIQTLNLSGTVLSLSKGGGSVTLPSSGGGDNWGTQVVVTDPTLSGNGTVSNPLKIPDNAVTSAKILDGAVANADLANSAVNSLKIQDSGIASADLADLAVTTAKLSDISVSTAKIQSGAVTSDKLAASAVTTDKINAVAVTSDKLATSAVTTDKINTGAVTGTKIAQSGALDGQVLKWNNASSVWAPANDATEAGTITLPWSGSTATGTENYAFTVISTGSDISAITGKQTNTTAGSGGYGVYGESLSPYGTGVYGYSNGTNGRGVYANAYVAVRANGNYRGLDANGDKAVEGRSYSATGFGVGGYSPVRGVYGESWNSGGSGVYGKSTGDPVWDTTCGVYGEANTEQAWGVKGYASDTIGANFGVFGESNSKNGYGVGGIAKKHGVYGKATGFQGVGLEGEAIADNSIGVSGKALNANGTGVYGEGYKQGIYGLSSNTGVFGSSTGYKGIGTTGEATGTNSVGVQGTAINSNSTGVWGEGDNQGVYGLSAKITGKGVYGSVSHTTGVNYGVFGETASSAGYGVYGKGPTYGIYGISNGINGFGVYGKSTTTTGYGLYGDAIKIGVYGVASSSTGTGLYGESLKYGVYGFASSSTGYGIYGESPKYGAYGKSTASTGRAVVGEAAGTSSIGVMGLGTNTSSTGVWGEGSLYDFYASGNGTNYGSASSIRWKKNIEPIPDPVGKIQSIRGVYFDWDPEHGGRHDVGMIAEEVGKVLPEIVVYEENGVDASGMDYSKITPLLVEAIKAQQAEIDLLKQKLAILEKLIVEKPTNNR
jgi:hypothetical protein